jgi:hypothetical protein
MAWTSEGFSVLRTSNENTNKCHKEAVIKHGPWNMEHGTPWNIDHETWNMEHGGTEISGRPN